MPPSQLVQCYFSVELSLCPQHARTSSLSSPFLFVALVECHGARVVSADVVKVLNLVKSDDPVLAGEGFLQCSQLRTFSWQLRAANSVLRLACREQGIIVVV